MSGKQRRRDSKLVSRIHEYLVDFEGSPLSADRIEDHLRKTYGEYTRQKKNRTFAIAIEKALQVIQKSDPGLLLEHKYQAKKRKTDPDLVELSEGEDPSSDSYVSYPDTNMLNGSLASIYSKQESNFVIDTTPSTSSQTTDKVEGVAESIRNTKEGERKLKRLRETKTPSGQKGPKKDSSNVDSFTFTRPAVSFKDVGGCEAQLTEICKLLIHLKHPEIYRRLGVTPPGGFLLHGPPGCGKTLIANAVAGELELPLIRVAAPELVSGVSGESEEKIRSLFARAKENAPCIMFLDEIDSITPKRETAQREMERRIVAQLLACLDDLNGESGGHVMVIGATNRPDSLEPALRRAGRFDKEIPLGIPDEKARAKILEVSCRHLKVAPNLNYKVLARMTPGFVGADLNSFVREASMCAIDRIFDSVTRNPRSSENAMVVEVEVVKSRPKFEMDLEKMLRWLKSEDLLGESELEGLFVTLEDFMLALKSVHPSAKREGFATVPDVSWEDVGALTSVREELKWSILFPVKCPEIFESVGLNSRPQGILLCGPPGCGKTLLAKAVANETGMNFISVKGPELLNMYVGESEKAVRQVFQRARNSVPCVIFFDELDALCPKRSDSDSGGSVRVVNQLLTEMDGMEARKQVFLIGATNRPDIIDPAVLRPGRLDKVVYVGFPTDEDRIDILRAVTKNGTKPRIPPDVSLEDIGKDARCQFFSGADVAALVREASVGALRDHIAQRYPDGVPDFREAMDKGGVDESEGASEECLVERKHFEMAFASVKPSVTVKERERYFMLEKKYRMYT